MEKPQSMAVRLKTRIMILPKLPHPDRLERAPDRVLARAIIRVTQADGPSSVCVPFHSCRYIFRSVSEARRMGGATCPP
jgi:hypothetical protein